MFSNYEFCVKNGFVVKSKGSLNKLMTSNCVRYMFELIKLNVKTLVSKLIILVNFTEMST